jgi:hypothetical protein
MQLESSATPLETSNPEKPWYASGKLSRIASIALLRHSSGGYDFFYPLKKYRKFLNVVLKIITLHNIQFV